MQKATGINFYLIVCTLEYHQTTPGCSASISIYIYISTDTHRVPCILHSISRTN